MHAKKPLAYELCTTETSNASASCQVFRCSCTCTNAGSADIKRSRRPKGHFRPIRTLTKPLEQGSYGLWDLHVKLESASTARSQQLVFESSYARSRIFRRIQHKLDHTPNPSLTRAYCDDFLKSLRLNVNLQEVQRSQFYSPEIVLRSRHKIFNGKWTCEIGSMPWPQ